MTALQNLIALIFAALALPGFAQQERLYFKHITSNEGLPSNHVETMLQDKLGFMWLGTTEGLARYDGYNFLPFTYAADDTNTIINNNIQCLAEDNQRNLWVGTQKGLSCIDLKTLRVKRFTHFGHESIGNLWVSSVCVVDGENILIGTLLRGCYLLNTRSNKLISFKTTGNAKGLANLTIRKIHKDNSGRIWLATDADLELFEMANLSFRHFFPGKGIQDIAQDYAGNLWISCRDERVLYCFDPKKMAIINQSEVDEQLRLHKKKLVFDMFGNRWLYVLDKGIWINYLNPKHETVCKYDKYFENGINSNAITSILEDKTGNIWIATFDKGVNLLNKGRKNFIGIRRNSLSNGLVSNNVRCIFQDRDGEIWIGTKNEGSLAKFDRNSMTFTNYKFDPQKSGGLHDDFVLSIADAGPGQLWVGTLNDGLNLFNKKTGQFTAIKHAPGSNRLSSNAILCLFNNDDGKLWIGHGTDGLDIYDPKTRIFESFKNSADSTSISDNYVRVIYKDSYGKIWVGTYVGLNLFDEKTKTFRQYLNNERNLNSLSDNNIISIYEDKKRRLWIGTANGLDLYDREKDIFTVYNKRNGFPAQSVRGIREDEHGNLWICTDNGIVKFSPGHQNFKHYTKDDGLISREFAAYANYQTRNGEIYFGSDEGFVFFNPQEMQDNPFRPDVVFTSFSLFNQAVMANNAGSPLDLDITNTQEITLNYKQSVFTLEFAALGFSSPEKSQYAYKMEGFDKDWNMVGTKRSATYTNLPEGNYTFRVKASNGDGLWNDQGATLRISILPPPWRSWWAYVIYSLIIILAFLKYRDMTIKKIHKQKAYELDQEKLNLFVNISHEFRTPLTLMLNPLDKIKRSENINEIRKSISVVEQSANKLLNLVNQLLDFRKIDQGKSLMNVKETNIISFCHQTCAVFDDLAKTKQIDLSFQSEYPELMLWVDEDKFEKILVNLLSNAFKFTEVGGKITISVTKAEGNPNDSFWKIVNLKAKTEFAEIRISDTGIGLKEEEIKKIFGRFYQVDPTKAGTGIGLNYAQSLANLHGGEIKIESQYQKGSSFIVRIPLGNKHLSKLNILKENETEHKFNAIDKEALRYDLENMDDRRIDAEASENAEKSVQNLSILIVEDNKSLRQQIAGVLSEKYAVKEAIDGTDGLEKANKHLPDLIITDIMMPRMDGTEMCRLLKTNIDTCHIPVIMLTAKGSVEDRIDGFRTGADEYLPKPFDMRLLEVRIENLIKTRVQLREKYKQSTGIIPAKEFTTNNLDEAFLEKMTKLVIENMEDSEFSLNELRQKMGMAQTTLYMKIQAITGQNPSNFVRTVKLKYAAELLLQNEISIKDVCFRCGFNSPAYFTKTFRELFGQTPSEYVEKMRQDGRI
jgi:signal transduction histidine kinase/ligand-binding sensor domain-containing protein/DNA-binding response OmpR family regulator